MKLTPHQIVALVTMVTINRVNLKIGPSRRCQSIIKLLMPCKVELGRFRFLKSVSVSFFFSFFSISVFQKITISVRFFGFSILNTELLNMNYDEL